MLVYHCANRRADKPSRISRKLAEMKNCRAKRGKRPCKYSYVLYVKGDAKCQQKEQ